MTRDTGRRWWTPMLARRPDEEHRVATPLELLFDLCFVVAVAQAALPLHHAVSEGHAGQGVAGYLMVFFAIWWAWMNFTWFASSYDTDDDVYRLTTMVQIAGALVLAAGVGSAVDGGDFTAITLGYVIMRLAMVVQWLRAAHGDPDRRGTALRYAAGIAVVQAGWLVRLALPDAWGVPTFVLLAIAELLVPLVGERRHAITTWHPHHIAERYGLFTIIVLGESVAAATIAVRTGLDTGAYTATLIGLAAAGLVIVFALWWLYFDRPAHDLLVDQRTAFAWGYGHYFIFASAAAVGAGLAVAVDHATHHSHLSTTAAGYAVAVPVSVFLLSTWLLHIRPHQTGMLRVVCPAVAVLVLLTPFGPASVQVIAALLAALVGVIITVGRRAPARAA